MNKKYLLIILLLGSLIALASILLTKNSTQKSPPLPIQTIKEPEQFVATFEIYTKGTRRDFSAAKYHNLNQDSFIESNPPYNLIVNSPNITWQKFFDTLPSPFKITANCLFTGTGQEFCNSESTKLYFYLNDQLDGNALEKVIQSGDKLVIKFE